MATSNDTPSLELKDVFSQKFVKATRTALNTLCANGASTSGPALCNAMGLTRDLGDAPKGRAAKLADEHRDERNQAMNIQTAVALAVRSGVISPYTISPGLGIHDPSVARQKARKTFPDGFVALATKTLAKLTKAAEGKPVTRRDVVEAMAKPGSQYESYLGDAINQGDITGFVSAKGVGILTQADWDARPKKAPKAAAPAS